MYRTFLAGLSLALLVASCASPSDSGAEDTDISVPGTRLSPIDEAVDDLSIRLGDGATIEVVTYEDVVWRDGAIGCPQPGMAYTQALEDGYRIVLTDGESVYHYHGVAAGAPFLCDNPSEPGSSGVDDESSTDVIEDTASAYSGPLADLVAAAVADLAERLSVPIGAIVVVSAESVVWPDGSLGCPIPGMRYTQVQVDGTKIVLSVNGSIYNYHSGATRDPFLCVTTKASDKSTTGLTLTGTTNPNE